MARRLFSKPIHAKEDRNGLPSADQGLSTAKKQPSYLLKPAHLPLSCPFCWLRTQVPRTLLEVTSPAESCMTHIIMRLTCTIR